MNVTNVARIAHEVDRAYLMTIGGNVGEPWEKASADDRDGVVMTVRAMSVGHVTPRSTHEAWVTEMIRNGWRRGETYSTKKKTHPNIGDYDELPPEVRARDAILAAVVRGALGRSEDSEADSTKGH